MCVSAMAALVPISVVYNVMFASITLIGTKATSAVLRARVGGAGASRAYATSESDFDV